MAKIALLIGVSEYGEGLTNLPGTQEDLQAMQLALENAQVGAFDDVQVLPNPNRTQMEVAIETLFTHSRQRDDLILLYFSGHGVRDDSGALYFGVNNTQKTPQGRIMTSTAVSSAAVQGYVDQSRSKRRVLILDCCFSGAFANDMRAKADEAIDVKAQLGGEGRAVLTSSTATQVSYEKEGASIYTRYLVQGLETGAADRNDDGHISIDELHAYAKEKVQEVAPTMQPEIYAVREGYKILIARAPQGEPKLVFRKELNERAKKKHGKLSRIDQRSFKRRAKDLRVAPTEAEQITQEVLQPYDIYWEKIGEFKEAVEDALQDDPQLGSESVDDLRYFQRVLKLRDEDIEELLTDHQIDLTAPSSPAVVEPQSSPTPQPEQALEAIPLESEKGVDYTKLRDLLAAGDWKGADQETYRRMLEAADREEEEYFRPEDLLEFPCVDLKTIDRLWVHSSKGKFGFSVQKKIYVECGAKLDGKYPGDKIWYKFCDRVGWRVNNKYTSYSKVTFDTSAKDAHLPLSTIARGRCLGCGLHFLASRLVNCSK